LNEDVLQEILVIPTNLKIIRATCPLITVKVFFFYATNINKKNKNKLIIFRFLGLN